MGCDIHGVFQKKVGDVWEDISSDYEQDRHYWLFAVLADVRSGSGDEPIAEPRGLPQDFEMVDGNYEDGSHLVKDSSILSPWLRKNYPNDLEVWMGEHSHSWLTADEMLDWYAENFDEDLAYFFDEVRKLRDEHGEVRFVFGFDS